jgi:hypothetical protein
VRTSKSLRTKHPYAPSFLFSSRPKNRCVSFIYRHPDETKSKAGFSYASASVTRLRRFARRFRTLEPTVIATIAPPFPRAEPTTSPLSALCLPPRSWTLPPRKKYSADQGARACPATAEARATFCSKPRSEGYELTCRWSIGLSHCETKRKLLLRKDVGETETTTLAGEQRFLGSRLAI